MTALSSSFVTVIDAAGDEIIEKLLQSCYSELYPDGSTHVSGVQIEL
jgi:hypothetical protein